MINNMEAPTQIDLDLLCAVESNALDVVSDLIERGANPYVLIPVVHSQFKSSVQNGKYTHFSCLFRALSLYNDDAIISVMLKSEKKLYSLPDAYIAKCGTAAAYCYQNMLDGWKGPVRCDLLSSIVEMTSLPSGSLQRVAKVLDCKLSGSDDRMIALGKVVAQYLRHFCSFQSIDSLKKALMLLELGADIGNKDDRESLFKSEFMVSIAGKKLSVALPIAIILGTSDYDCAPALNAFLEHCDLDKNFRCNGMTLLQWCACFDRSSSIEVLLTAGADTEAKTNSFSHIDGGETAQSALLLPPMASALEIASFSNATDAAVRLRAFGARSSMQAIILAARTRHAAKQENNSVCLDSSYGAAGDALSDARLRVTNALASLTAQAAVAANAGMAEMAA
jgi:hypothetical protein